MDKTFHDKTCFVDFAHFIISTFFLFEVNILLILDANLPQEEYDTHDPKGQVSMVLPFLRKRSKIIEIVAARDIVFALAQSGVCAAFSRGKDMKHLYFCFFLRNIFFTFHKGLTQFSVCRDQ